MLSHTIMHYLRYWIVRLVYAWCRTDWVLKQIDIAILRMLFWEEVLMLPQLSYTAIIIFLASSLVLFDAWVGLQKLGLLHYCGLKVGLIVLNQLWPDLSFLLLLHALLENVSSFIVLNLRRILGYLNVICSRWVFAALTRNLLLLFLLLLKEFAKNSYGVHLSAGLVVWIAAFDVES